MYHQSQPNNGTKEFVVVSGMSGRFPKSANVDEFWSNLIKGVDMMSVPGRRFPPDMNCLPKRMGHLENLDQFDYEFFNIPKKEADEMDTQLRIALEVIYEAIIDSGHTLDEIRGKRTGFFHSLVFYEAKHLIQELPFDNLNYINSYAGLVPFIFDLKGPVFAADTACSSSQYAMTEAFSAICHGLCDKAIILSLNYCQNSTPSRQFMELQLCSKDGTSRSLDASASGYARSEAVVALILEKQVNANRCYMKILNSKIDVDGMKKEGILHPAGNRQMNLIQDTFNEIGLDPYQVDYVEGHLTATRTGDAIEGKTIYKCFAEKRDKPLLIGCLKTNLGHTEASSGVAATIKSALIFQKGVIPANLHYRQPNPNIQGLVNGKMRPVTENTPYNGQYIAMQSFGFGGANAHSIFERFQYKSAPDDFFLSKNLPRLVCLQARNPDSLKYLQTYLEAKQSYLTKPFLYLMDRYSKRQNFLMTSRGYSLITNQQNSNAFRHFVGDFNYSKKPVVIISLPSLCDGQFVFEQSFKEFELWSIVSDIFCKIANKFGFELNELFEAINCNNTDHQRLLAFASQTVLLQLFKNLGIEFKLRIENTFQKYLSDHFSGKISLEEVFKYIFEYKSENNDISPDYTIESSNMDKDENNEEERFKVFLGFDLQNTTEKEFSKRVSLADKKGQFYTISGFQFLKCLGELYSIGIDIDVENLYPTVKLPVPSDTLSLHSIMKWDRSKKVNLYSFPEYYNVFQSTCKKFTIEVCEDDSSFYFDHKIDGSPLFPATGYLMLAWSAVAEFHYSSLLKFPVTLKDVKFERATYLSEKSMIFRVYYLPGTGRFIIKEGDSVVTVGSIFPLSESEAQKEFEKNDDVPFASELLLETKDVYKELRIRGYDYGKTFKCIKEANEFGRFGRINWSNPLGQNNLLGSSEEDDFFRTWITFSDSLLQLAILSNRVTRDLLIPIGLTSLSCDPKMMLQTIQTQGSDPSLLAVHNFDENTVQTTGLKIKGLLGAKKNRKNQLVQLGKFIFIPYNDHIDVLNEKEKANINLYRENCEFLYEILSKQKNSVEINHRKLVDLDKVVKIYPEDNPKYSLFHKYLNQLHGLHGTPVQSTDLNDDLLVGSDSELFHHERFLFSFANTIFTELSRKRKMTIWERNDGRYFLADKFIKVFDALMIDATDYTILQSSDNKSENLPNGVMKCIANSDNGQYGVCSGKKFDLLIYKVFSESLFISEISKFIEKSSKSSMILVLLMQRQKDLKVDQREKIDISVESVTETMNNLDCIVLQQISIDTGSSFLKGILFRQVCKRESVNHVISINSFNYQWIDELKEVIAKCEREDRIWLTSDTNELNGVLGLMRCLAQEQFGDQIYCIVNRPKSSYFSTKLNAFDSESQDFKELLRKNMKVNIYDPDHGYGSYNFLLFEEDQQKFRATESAYVQVMTPGDLTSLTWTETEIDAEDSRKVAIDIHFAALNFKDVMLATGRLTQIADISSKAAPMSIDIGLDYSGVDMETGERIMGVLPGRGIATRACVLRNNFMWKVPDDWTMEEAATIPTVYSTVVYALFVRGNIRNGESVLVHAGAGGIGIAAITICHSMNCKVFTTVGTQEKRNFIKKRFPTMKDSCIFNSRDTTFEQKILTATNGEGVDIILNSLSDEKLQASLRCLAPGGRFLEIGKYDMIQNSQINIGQLDEGRSFHGICLDTMIPTDSQTLDLNSTKLTSQLISKLIDEKIIKPLPTICFKKDEIEEAFRFMANGKHIGKVLIKIRDNDQQFTRVNAKRIVKFSSEKIYIIVGGFGGIGLELALWMTERGARHIILNSRSGPKTQYHHYCLRILEERGANVTISNHDLTSQEKTKIMINKCTHPIGGFFNSALVLRDALFADQTVADFEAVCRPKISITANFDQLSRDLCPELDYFVVFSSVACGFGNLGQSNYGLANSFMESICEKRRLDGLHGLAIELGAVGDVGYVADTYETDVRLRGTIPQRLPSILSTLEKFLLTSESIVSSLTPAEVERDKNDSGGSFLKDVIHIFQIKDISSIEPRTSLADLGMDSLMGIEIQQAIERRFNLTLEAKRIRTLLWDDVINFESRATKMNETGTQKSNTLND